MATSLTTSASPVNPPVATTGLCPRAASPATNNRVLIVDDNPAIHEDFRKVLAPTVTAVTDLERAEALLFGSSEAPAINVRFELNFARQGQEALVKVRHALAEGLPYAMAFVDVRMPPGWDGIETVAHLWQVCPDLQIVICTAYSDYSWEQMIRKLGFSDRLVILKKPFDNQEVLQLASALCRKWDLEKQAQTRLEDLSRMVAARTADLVQANENLRQEIEIRVEAERQMRQAQKMEAVGQLAAGIAHDFNNILTVIHGHASMLHLRLGEEGLHARSVNEIRNSADRAANLVRRLLTFSRKQQLQFRDVDLCDVVQSVSSMLRQLVGEHIKVELCTPEGLPTVYADRGMVEQVILNLIINSRDAMPNGGSLQVRCQTFSTPDNSLATHPEAQPGDHVCLVVADTGCGMDANAMSHLFEPFFTTKEVGKGTGLGLATIYGIVKQHRGWIEVDSHPGAGTTFRIYFPVSTQTAPADPPVAAAPQSLAGDETILLAEDESTLREIVSEALRAQGYHVLSAGSGPEAMQLARQASKHIHLLMTDIVMPGGMLGTELATKLKHAHPRLKVIYTTGYSPGMQRAEHCLEEGVNFIPKPYAPAKLAEMIRRCLDA